MVFSLGLIHTLVSLYHTVGLVYDVLYCLLYHLIYPLWLVVTN